MLRNMSTNSTSTRANPVLGLWRTYPLMILSIPTATVGYLAFRAAESSTGGLMDNVVVLAIAGFILLLGVAGVAPAYAREQFQRSGILSADQMDGVTFEHRLESLYQYLGYTVETTKTSGDFGADLVLMKDGTRTVVQAKRYSSNVGLEAVQEAVAAKAMYQASRAVVATNSFYTKAAQELAAANGVELIDRPKLTAMLAEQSGTLGQRRGLRLLVVQMGTGIRPVTFFLYAVVATVVRTATRTIGMLLGARR